MLTVKIIDNDGSTLVIECLEAELFARGTEHFKEEESINTFIGLFDGVSSLVEVIKPDGSKRTYYVHDGGALYVTDSNGNTVLTFIS